MAFVYTLKHGEEINNRFSKHIILFHLLLPLFIFCIIQQLLQNLEIITQRNSQTELAACAVKEDNNKWISIFKLLHEEMF
jgi:hypothetical protein